VLEIPVEVLVDALDDLGPQVLPACADLDFSEMLIFGEELIWDAHDHVRCR